MNSNVLTKLTPIQIVGGATACSLLAAISAAMTLKLLRRRQDEALSRLASQVPVQPAVMIATPATVPDHFTEDVILPGLTETGAQIMQHDAEEGRSQEGV